MGSWEIRRIRHRLRQNPQKYLGLPDPERAAVGEIYGFPRSPHGGRRPIKGPGRRRRGEASHDLGRVHLAAGGKLGRYSRRIGERPFRVATVSIHRTPTITPCFKDLHGHSALRRTSFLPSQLDIAGRSFNALTAIPRCDGTGSKGRSWSSPWPPSFNALTAIPRCDGFRSPFSRQWTLSFQCLDGHSALRHRAPPPTTGVRPPTVSMP